MKINKIRNFFVKNWTAKLISLAIAVIFSLFYKQSIIEERYLRVPFRVLSPEGFVTVDNIPKNIKISLKGNRDDIYSIISDDINVYADFRDVTEEGSYERALKVERQGNALYMSPLEINVEPLKISVFYEEKKMKRLALEPVFIGIPAEGYELAGSFLTPGTITAMGPEKSLQRIKVLKTKPVSINGKTENFTTVVEIDNSDSFVDIQDRNIMLSVNIARIRTAKTFPAVDIEIQGCGDNLSADSVISQGVVKIETGGRDADGIKAGDLKLTADISGIKEPGTYRVPLRVITAKNVDIIDFSPDSVSVTIEAVEAVPAEE